MHICKIEELMNPWHSTDPDKPCPAGCEKGHMPKEKGEYWAILTNYRSWKIPKHLSFTPSFQDHHKVTYKERWATVMGNRYVGTPKFYRIPDGHPPIPEE